MDITDLLYGGSEITGGTGHRVDIVDTVYTAKDMNISKLIPGVISECSILGSGGAHCMTTDTVSVIGDALNIGGDSRKIVEGAKAKLQCATERCVLGKMVTVLGEDVVRREINLNLKVRGPTDSKLLSNIHIDTTLKQWATRFTNFFPYSFNMRNYASYAYENGYVLNHPDTLATIQFSDLYFGDFNGVKYRCCACVINTDTYQGAGKHWMALFADTRSDDSWTIEFFNSSGNSPAPEWVNWLEKTKCGMEMIAEREGKTPTITIVKATSIRHQKSMSECGLYSLFYIWARLHNVPPKYFSSNKITDQLMFEFRQHLFDDPDRPALKIFNWDEYKNTAQIRWESN